MKKTLFALTLCLSVTAVQAVSIDQFFSEINIDVLKGSKQNIVNACNKLFTKRTRPFFETKQGTTGNVYADKNVANQLVEFFANVKDEAEKKWRPTAMMKQILPTFNAFEATLDRSLRHALIVAKQNKSLAHARLLTFQRAQAFFNKYK